MKLALFDTDIPSSGDVPEISPVFNDLLGGASTLNEDPRPFGRLTKRLSEPRVVTNLVGHDRGKSPPALLISRVLVEPREHALPRRTSLQPRHNQLVDVINADICQPADGIGATLREVLGHHFDSRLSQVIAIHVHSSWCTAGKVVHCQNDMQIRLTTRSSCKSTKMRSHLLKRAVLQPRFTLGDYRGHAMRGI